MSVLSDLANFVGELGTSIQVAFRSVQKFFMGVELVWLNFVFILVFVLFFLIVATMIVLPVKFYPYFIKIKYFFNKFIEKK